MFQGIYFEVGGYCDTVGLESMGHVLELNVLANTIIKDDTNCLPQDLH